MDATQINIEIAKLTQRGFTRGQAIDALKDRGLAVGDFKVWDAADTIANTADHFQTFSSNILAAIASGQVDARRLALDELASRGADIDGKWVGFDKAASMAGAVLGSAKSRRKQKSSAANGKLGGRPRKTRRSTK